ncbi:hypothetical protein AALO_G00225020 [Alosa alosa]|uniref:Ig-like domain-containing protein n=1 Tax=Alosa alosa TaxID=278164 RepID=A0AAV6G517_9TELE|nr:SLAM family member 6-like isoform X1 [Alosa alosa]KAG5267731.1 hypothetical protein AALO_G00225020 [Alosa alosa]
MKQQALSLLFLTVQICSSEDTVDAILNGVVTLSPVGGPPQIENVAWKFGNDKVAEYDPTFDKEAQYYGRFRERTTLNVKSGSIAISTLTNGDEGKYSVEVNNVLLTKTFSLKLFEQVRNIKISRENSSVPCKLSCKAEPDPLNYQWIGGVQPGDETNILFVEEVDWSKSFTCVARNRASQANATVIAEGLCRDGWSILKKTLVGVILTTGAVGLAVFAVFFIKKGNILRHNPTTTTTTTAAATNGTGSNKTAEEGMPLADA